MSKQVPCLLMRDALADQEEKDEAFKYFSVYRTRSAVPANSLVVGRYSVLPYYEELEEDLRLSGSQLINSYAQHLYVADMREWYSDLREFTPRTWFSLADFKREARSSSGSFVLKGQTNSKKQQWNTHMFAASISAVDEVYSRLRDDGFLCDQEIYIRSYVALRSFGEGVRGLPITEEYRFFVLFGDIIASGFYWSQFPEVKEELGLDPCSVPQDFLDEVISRVSPNVNFFVLDVGKTAAGDWMVVELNDGCMAGLSDCNPEELYRNMALTLQKRGAK